MSAPPFRRGSVILPRYGNISQIERLRKKKFELVKILGGKCCICEYNKCNAALEFHHKGNKEGSLAKMIRDISKQKALKELKKCILLCANCHRELHHGCVV